MWKIDKVKDSIELYKFAKAQETLNKKLWENDELKPEVRKELERIANEFIDKLKEIVPTITIEDIWLVGSNVSFNYTKYSDIDLHIIYDNVDEDTYHDLINDCKNDFNNSHDYKIEGYKVEVYAEKTGSTNVSNGKYSFSKGWIQYPEWQEVYINANQINKLFEEYEDKYTTLVDDLLLVTPEKAYDNIDAFLRDMTTLRQYALAKEGEYAPFNIVYKEFRNKGYFDRLRKLKAEFEKKFVRDSAQTKRVEYKGFKIEYFPYTWNIGDKETKIEAWIILSDTKLGDDLYLPLYPENEKGEVLNFNSLAEAKAWIDKFGENYHVEIKHGDEIHAIPNNLVEDANYEEEYQEEDFEPITEEELEDLSKEDEFNRYFEITKLSKDGDNEHAVKATLYNLPSKELFTAWFKKYVGYAEKTYLNYKKYNLSIWYDGMSFLVEYSSLRWIFNTIEEIYDFLTEAEKRISAQAEEEENYIAYVDLQRDKIDSFISEVNAEPTIEMIAKLESWLDMYSDIYKEQYGYRPRHDIAWFRERLSKEAKDKFKEFCDLPYEKQVDLINQVNSKEAKK